MRQTDNVAVAPIGLGLIADDEHSATLAEAIRRCGDFELRAQMGMRASAAAADVPRCDDTRLFLARGDLDAVVVGTDTRACAENARLCRENGMHVWHAPPIARDFAEAVQVVGSAADATSGLAVPSWWDRICDTVRSATADACDPAIKPHLVDISICAPSPGNDSFWNSRRLSAGGVLARDAYTLLEALVAMRGLPQSIYAIAGDLPGTTPRTPRETEGIARIVCKYSGGAVATIHAAWDSGPPAATATFFIGELVLELLPTCVRTRDESGGVLREAALPPFSLVDQLAEFAARLRQQADRRDRRRRMARHLAVTALLETAYLSAATGQPELPSTLYRLQGWPEPE